MKPKGKTLGRWACQLALAVLIALLFVPGANAAGKKVWSIDVARFGYHVDRLRTIVRWRGQYVVIGSSMFVRDEATRQCLPAFDPGQPMLVFDTVTHKQLPKEVLGSYVQEWEPPRAHRNFYPCEEKGRYEPTAPFITDKLRYNDDYEQHRFIVTDENWKEKYRIAPGRLGCWGTCVVSNRAGTRFAIMDKGETPLVWLGNRINTLKDQYDTDKKVIKVYSAQDGKKLFQLSWRENEQAWGPGPDESERVSFSDDGESLAVLRDDARLQIFRISDDP
jgi:hypothetical protein